MKKTLIIVNAALAVAVVILFVLVLGRKATTEEKPENAEIEKEAGSIVYINTDSLLLNYAFAQHLSEQLMGQEESSRTDFNERARTFQSEMVEFNRKVQNNSFLSLERAQNEERRLRQREAELQELNARLSNDLVEEQGRISQQLRDTITGFLKEYCMDKPYSIVLSNTMGDNILYSTEGLDITSVVVEKLNARYASSQKK
ncbi:MAG: OmpH family outer membrane protein [Cytophagaceae bacterium]|jgi:outer membrane protein|nr:OmpH family outer membrane protein [Cytophagaceae bacterium]